MGPAEAKMDTSTLFKLGYGLYVLTSRDGDRDNGCIINTIMQVTSVAPFIEVVTVNKQNYSHDLIMNSGKFNISVLTEETPFDIFTRFGFQSGRSNDKYSGFPDIGRSKNGLIYLSKYTNAYLSFEVTETYDFGSHTMFRAVMTDGEATGKADSVTYTYYQRHIKPKPQAAQKKGYRCKICGYVYEGDVLPDDFICPICKHGVSDFEKL